MGMGIVSDADFEKEMTRIVPEALPVSVPIPEVLPMEHPGRTEGDVNVPNNLRKIIGETSELEGREAALELASRFGVSNSSVSAYANGSTSTASMHKQPNLGAINAAKIRVATKARKKLLLSLHHITEEKLQDAKPEVLASVARNMSAIIKEMEPEQEKEKNDDKAPQFVVFAPTIKQENNYEVIKARE